MKSGGALAVKTIVIDRQHSLSPSQTFIQARASFFFPMAF